jgi:hypothetical protein
VTGFPALFSGAENERSARVAFPAVPCCVGEFDADDVVAVADVGHLTRDVLGNLDETLLLRLQDPDPLQRAAEHPRLPVSAAPLFGHIVEEGPYIEDGEVGRVVDERAPIRPGLKAKEAIIRAA